MADRVLASVRRPVAMGDDEIVVTASVGIALSSTTIVVLAHSLGVGVIAEGVETREQLRFLRSHSSEEMQGYLFSPPVPADRFDAMVSGGKRLDGE